MSDIFYTEDHEWVLIEGDIGVVGISPYAQEQLGDVVYVELPEIGKALKQKDEAAVVESVKAASEVYAPLSGEVVEVNEALSGEPALVNQDASGAGWFLKIKISDTSETGNLMTEDEYKSYTDGLG